LEGGFFSCWTFFSPRKFCPSGRFVPPVVLSQDVSSLQMFCPSGRFVLPDIFSPRHFVPPDVFPPDVLSPNVRSPDVVSLNVFSGHRQNINADVQKIMYTCAHMNINHLLKYISLSVIGKH
jgi:hypothetical protein